MHRKPSIVKKTKQTFVFVYYNLFLLNNIRITTISLNWFGFLQAIFLHINTHIFPALSFVSPGIFFDLLTIGFLPKPAVRSAFLSPGRVLLVSFKVIRVVLTPAQQVLDLPFLLAGRFRTNSLPGVIFAGSKFFLTYPAYHTKNVS